MNDHNTSNDHLDAAWSNFCRDTPVHLRGPWEAFQYAWNARQLPSETLLAQPIACTDRMPPEREYVLMWEVPSLHWSVGSWWPEYQQWGNRDDKEYAIHPDQVSHWMPLPKAITVTAAALPASHETQEQRALKEIREICMTDYGPAAMARITDIVKMTLKYSER